MLKFKNKYLFYSFYWGIILYIFYNHFKTISFIQDDAFTVLRYVKNFLEGNGLVFNVGEKVEGYTNFLWVILLSVIYKSGNLLKLNFNLPQLTQLLSSFFGLVFLIAVYVTSWKIFSSLKNYNKTLQYISFIFPVMILFTTPFNYWSFSGMETSLFATLTLLSIHFLIDFEKGNNYKYFLLTSILNSLLRPEGLLFFVLLIVVDIIYSFLVATKVSLFDETNKIISSKKKKVIVIFLLIQLVYISFRFVYYGFPLPNTFYAKTEFTFNFLLRGIDYFLKYIKTDLYYGVVLLPVILRFALKKFDRIEFIIFSFGIIYIILTIIIGGDVLPIGRFYIPITPLFYMLFFYSLLNLKQFYELKMNSIIIGLLFVTTIISSIINYDSNKTEMMEKRSYEIGLVTKMKSYADWIKNNQTKNVTVALSTIGAFSFYSNVKVIDIVGLTDEYIAHHPKEVDGIDENLPIFWKERHYNADYVINQKPDFIIFPAGAKPSAFAECAIFINDEFYKIYYLQLFYADGFDQLLPIFFKRNSVRIDSSDCNVKFLSHYINANNLFLSLVKTKNRKIINEILHQADLANQYCPKRVSEINSIKGMSFYHLGNFNIAKKYFEDSIEEDSMNTISLFYLMNTYSKLNEIDNAEKTIIRLRKISSYAIKDLYYN